MLAKGRRKQMQGKEKNLSGHHVVKGDAVEFLVMDPQFQHLG